jgi:hypothetical protein
LKQIVDSFPKKTLFDGQLLLREAYDQSYGIFNHLGQAQHARDSTDLKAKRPLALFAYFAAENDSGTPRSYGYLADRFLDLQLHLFGITIFEFLDLPRAQAEILIKAAESRANVALKVTDEINKGLKDLRR